MLLAFSILNQREIEGIYFNTRIGEGKEIYVPKIFSMYFFIRNIFSLICFLRSLYQQLDVTSVTFFLSYSRILIVKNFSSILSLMNDIFLNLV